MRKLFVLSLFFVCLSTVKAQVADSVMYAHVATMFPYHAPEYVMAHAEKKTVKKEDKDVYQASVDGLHWTGATIRVGETYYRFDGKYFYNMTRQMLLYKAPEVAKQKEKKVHGQVFAQFAQQTVSGITTRVLTGNTYGPNGMMGADGKPISQAPGTRAF